MPLQLRQAEQGAGGHGEVHFGTEDATECGERCGQDFLVHAKAGTI